MTHKNALVVCKNFERETSATLATLGLEDVDIITYPGHCCDGKGLGGDLAAETVDLPKGFDRVDLIVGKRCPRSRLSLEQLRGCAVHRADHCLYLLSDKKLVDDLIASGAYLVTPGWLEQWRQGPLESGDRIEKNLPPAIEAATRIVLLDTGVDPNSQEYLREFGAAVGRPYETIPVGLSSFTSFLASQVVSALRAELAEAESDLAESVQLSSQYTMLTDTISQLLAPMTEKKTIERILDLFVELFGPSAAVYVPYEQNAQEEVERGSGALFDRPKLESLLAGFPKDKQWIHFGDGFLLRIGTAEEQLGFVGIDGLAFPESFEHYLNLALSISQVCGLAVSNARRLGQLKATKRLLAVEKERLAVTLRSTGDAVISTDVSETMELFNPAAEQITGWKQSEALNRPLGVVFQLLNERTREHLENLVKTTVLTGEATDLADGTVLVAKDGRERQIALTAAPIRQDDESIIGVVLVFRDVTTQRRTEEALRESETLYRWIVETATEGIWLVDANGRTTFVNSAMASMLGYTPKEMMGKPLFAFMDEETKAGARQFFEHRLDGVRKQHDGKFLRKDGAEIWALINTRLIPDKEGRYGGALRMVTDVTERKLAELRLAESARTLRRTLDGMVETIALMAEMRDPYTAGHQRRVAQLATAIGKEFGFSQDQLDGLWVAALVHDIGKIQVPAEILTKPGRLTDIEFSLIKAHSQMGAEILGRVLFPWPIARIVLQHHERMNGSGYPAGLAGEDILLEARIVAVADVVEAMASHRPYRPALGLESALEEVQLGRSVLYDPEVVDACRKVFLGKGFAFQDEHGKVQTPEHSLSIAAFPKKKNGGRSKSVVHLH